MSETYGHFKTELIMTSIGAFLVRVLQDGEAVWCKEYETAPEMDATKADIQATFGQ